VEHTFQTTATAGSFAIGEERTKSNKLPCVPQKAVTCSSILYNSDIDVNTEKPIYY